MPPAKTPAPLGTLRPLAMSQAPPSKDDGCDAPAPARPGRSRPLVAMLLALAGFVSALPAWSSASRERKHDVAPIVVSGKANPKKIDGHDERWRARALTLTLDGSLDAIDDGAKDAVRSAAGTWVSSGAALPEVRFDASSGSGVATRDGVNRILIGPITESGHERDVAITVAYVDAATGEILEADIILNAAYSFGIVDDTSGEDRGAAGSEHLACKSGAYDVQNVVTHELGHLLGLGEDMDDHHATMFITSRPCQTHKRVLTEPDVSAMTALYTGSNPGANADTVPAPASSSQASGCGGKVDSSHDAAPTKSGATTMIGVAMILRAFRRRAAKKDMRTVQTHGRV